MNRGSGKSQLYTHIVWSTKQRLPLITPEIVNPIYGCICGQRDGMRIELIALNGMEDHVHLLIQMPTTPSAATVAKQVKGISLHLVRTILKQSHLGGRMVAAHSLFRAGTFQNFGAI